MTLRAIASAVISLGSFAASGSAVPPLPQKESIATGARRQAANSLNSFWLILLILCQEGFLRFTHILQCQCARIDQVSHDRPASAAEQAQQVVNQPAFGRLTGHRCLEDIRGGDLLDTAQDFLDFQAVDYRLHRCVGWPLLGGECFVYFAD